VVELRERITFSEFIDWLVFLNHEEERNTKLDHYLAQIASEVRRSYVSKPRTVKTKDFLFAMTTVKPKAPEEKVKRSKSAWGAIVGVKIG